MKVFRNIRQKLAAENKVMAYLRYAVGEIFLVVIGILIALQVNNWNELRKNNNAANEALLSLRADFQDNITQIKDRISRVNKTTEHLNSVIKIIDRDSSIVNPDSLGLYLASGASWWSVKITSSTYDALSGAGNLDLIQDKNLRKLLAEFYSTTKSGFEDEGVSETLAVKIWEKTSSEIYTLWPKLESYNIKLTKKSPVLKKKAVNSILKMHDIMGILIIKQVLNQNQQEYLANLLSLSHKILDEINKELK
jgi:hypothetical protein